MHFTVYHSILFFSLFKNLPGNKEKDEITYATFRFIYLYKNMYVMGFARYRG